MSPLLLGWRAAVGLLWAQLYGSRPRDHLSSGYSISRGGGYLAGCARRLLPEPRPGHRTLTAAHSRPGADDHPACPARQRPVIRYRSAAGQRPFRNDHYRPWHGRVPGPPRRRRPSRPWHQRAPTARRPWPVRRPRVPARRPRSRVGHRRHRRPGGPGHARRDARRLRAPDRRFRRLQRTPDRRRHRPHRLRPAHRPPAHRCPGARPSPYPRRWPLPPFPRRLPLPVTNPRPASHLPPAVTVQPAELEIAMPRSRGNATWAWIHQPGSHTEVPAGPARLFTGRGPARIYGRRADPAIWPHRDGCVMNESGPTLEAKYAWMKFERARRPVSEAATATRPVRRAGAGLFM